MESDSLFHYRVSFTAPGGRDVAFYWLNALDDVGAAAQGETYAELHGYDGWTMDVWKPEHLNGLTARASLRTLEGALTKPSFGVGEGGYG